MESYNCEKILITAVATKITSSNYQSTNALMKCNVVLTIRIYLTNRMLVYRICSALCSLVVQYSYSALRSERATIYTCSCMRRHGYLHTHTSTCNCCPYARLMHLQRNTRLPSTHRQTTHVHAIFTLVTLTMTSIHELKMYLWKMYLRSTNKLSRQRNLKLMAMQLYGW